MDPNFDEALVPAYALPDPLAFDDGRPVRDAAGWRARRAELLEHFAREVYGRTPPLPAEVRVELRAERPLALGGAATRRELRVHLGDGQRMDMLVYLPRGLGRPAPLFLGLNFRGNHAASAEMDSLPCESWAPDGAPPGAGRASESTRWPAARVVARGYGLATVCYADIDPDVDDGFQNGVHRLSARLGQPERGPDSWGAIGAWAWGLSRALDALSADPDVDARRVAVVGHSRLGKAALWAGAQDERFAMVVSNNSGSGGAALSRRCFGETVAHINRQFPHWFCENFRRYGGREAELPVDQHELLALVAPRPLYVASASEDLWADPRGEFLAALGAAPVYGLLGAGGLPAAEMPPVGEPALGQVSYHIRAGAHDLTPYDWERFMDAADRFLG